MKILAVHNFYGSEAPSGENTVFESETGLLRRRGHQVEEFTRYSDEIRRAGVYGKLRGAFATPWNPWMAKAIASKVNAWKPDVVHVHNTFPLISPAIFSAISADCARVLTLHNYRLFCPAAIPMRDGKVCTDCLDFRSAWPAVKHGCYRGSRIATVPLAFSVGLHRRLSTWQNNVDAFIALTDFQKTRMVDAGLPAAKVFVKPNFYPGRPDVIPWTERLPYVVFAGRLSYEKGITTLIEAWSRWVMNGSSPPELHILGDGPLRHELETRAANLPVRFLGQLSAQEAQAQIAGARFLIAPSECFEGFPMVIREAFAFGTPVATSNLGPLPSIVQHGVSGVVFEPANPESLEYVVSNTWKTHGLLERLGQGARQSFEMRYTEDANYELLMDIYAAAIKVQKLTTS